MIEEYSTTDIQSSTLKLLQETDEFWDIATVEIWIEKRPGHISPQKSKEKNKKFINAEKQWSLF